MKRQFSQIGAMLITLASLAAHAQTPAPLANPPAAAVNAQSQARNMATMLASYGDVKLTLLDYEASILRIPERDRFGWAMSQERVVKEIDTLLKIRTVSEEAKRLGLDRDERFQQRVKQYAERLMTEAYASRIDDESVAEFETKRESFLARAREQYLINKKQYQQPKEVNASHILVDTKARTPAEALAMIKALRARVIAGESFEMLAQTASDDLTSRASKGELGFFGPGRMDPAFEAAAFALKQPLEISEPVRSQFGYHLIRLEEIKPERMLSFEEASPDLMEKLKQQYVELRRSQMIGKLYDPSKAQWNEPAVAALKKTVDPSVYRLPQQRK